MMYFSFDFWFLLSEGKIIQFYSRQMNDRRRLKYPLYIRQALVPSVLRDDPDITERKLVKTGFGERLANIFVTAAVIGWQSIFNQSKRVL